MSKAFIALAESCIALHIFRFLDNGLQKLLLHDFVTYVSDRPLLSRNGRACEDGLQLITVI